MVAKRIQLFDRCHLMPIYLFFYETNNDSCVFYFSVTAVVNFKVCYTQDDWILFSVDDMVDNNMST